MPLDEDPMETDAFDRQLARYERKVIARLRGVWPRECPCCGYAGKFRAFGQPPRYDALCPACGSLERHRLLARLLAGGHFLKPAHKLLHFAPEAVVAGMLRPQVGTYRTADLAEGRADMVLNIEDIALDANSYDVVLASHVLEHVDDRKALKELWRILKPDGLLIILIPIVEGWDTTYENPGVTSEDERDLHFGQGDHVRRYGRDFRERLTATGFALDEYSATGQDCVRYGLLPGEIVFLARALKA